MARYHRKIIHISAEDSPNVRLALAEIRAGETPSHEKVCEGVLTYREYRKRRKTWDKVRQCVGLDGRFWEGGETLMFPPTWLNRAERLWLFMRRRPRIARGMGIDPGEGSANTAYSIVDEYGLIEQVSFKTPNTHDIVVKTLDLMNKYKLAPERVLFDRGGGGKQHADNLRNMGFNVQTIGFGDRPTNAIKRGITMFKEKVETQEKRSVYLNMRAEMYGELRILLDPESDERDYESDMAWDEVALEKEYTRGQLRGFTINPAYTKLREQLAPIPLLRDSEGKMKLPPKHKKDENSKERTLVDIIGYSPDEADSLVLAVRAMQRANSVRTTAGAI